MMIKKIGLIMMFLAGCAGAVPAATQESPAQESPAQENPAQESPAQENPAQENPTILDNTAKDDPGTTTLTRSGTVHDAIRKGLDYLQTRQGKDGAWGSHDPNVVDSAQLAFGMRNFGCHDGVRIACTAICAKALLLYPRRTREDTRGLEAAIRCLLRDWKLAYDPGNAFNCWGYCYNLDFLTALNAHPLGKPYEKAIEETIPKVIDGLKRMQVADGGWAYYTSVMMDGSSLSFTTASIMLALMEARNQGFEVPEGMIRDAGRIIKSQVLPDRNVIYGTHLKYSGSHMLEDLSCCGRNQVCGLALHLYDNHFTRKDLLAASRHFHETIDYIEVTGNKRLIPHRDAPQNISGYFLYYGCYYAGEVLTYLDEIAPGECWEHLVRLILRHQETEGGWWDTIFYDYGDKYGTGFAILCLIRFLESKGELN